MDLFFKAASINHIMFPCKKCEDNPAEKEILKTFIYCVPLIYRADIIIETMGAFHTLLHANSTIQKDVLIYKHSSFVEPIHKTLKRIGEEWTFNLATLMEDIMKER